MSNGYHAGIDAFSPDPGTETAMFCRACGANMDVTRNVTGPTGMAEAMAGKGHAHDSFTCPNVGAKWHWDICELMLERNAHKSPSIRKIAQGDINAILAGQGIVGEVD